MLTTNWSSIWRAACELARPRSVSPSSILADIVRTQWSMGFTPRDFLLMALQDRNHEERASWVGTVDMYRAQKIWNPPPARDVLVDKEKFARIFEGLMDPRRLVVKNPEQAPSLKRWLDEVGTSTVISKPVGGQAGKGVLQHSISHNGAIEVDGRILDAPSLASLGLPRVFEPKLESHSDLAAVYAGSLNTVRVLTFRDQNGTTRIFATRVRFGRSGHTDNLSSGGLAAAVAPDSGTVSGPAVSTSLLGVQRFSEHPESGAQIEGLQLPHWPEVRDLVHAATSILPSARCVGWDVAITPSGPVLLEGNHNWGKILWQLPIDRGLRSEVEEMLLA
jgi:hypothetical protein